MFYRYGEHNPVHFSIVAEFDVALNETQVESALEAVRRRHPLMSVCVRDHPETRLCFYRPHATAPIPLRVHSDVPWQRLAADELSRRFDRSTGPLMRAILGVGPSHSAIVLTFEHTVADGISSVLVLGDLLVALNGGLLDAVPAPPSQESMLASAFNAGIRPPAAYLAQSDPRMLAPT